MFELKFDYPESAGFDRPGPFRLIGSFGSDIPVAERGKRFVAGLAGFPTAERTPILLPSNAEESADVSAGTPDPDPAPPPR